MLRVAVFIFVALPTLEGPAAAYLDPGSGSMLVHVLLGGVAVVGVIARLYWHRLAVFFRGKPQAPKR